MGEGALQELLERSTVLLQTDEPTAVRFDDVSDWVIWQFPRPQGRWLCGAAHPPLPSFGWVPVLIRPEEKKLRIFANAGHVFETPEAAADWLAGAT